MCPDNLLLLLQLDKTHQVLIWNKTQWFLLSFPPRPPISEYILKILFPSFWVTCLSWFSFLDSVTFPSVHLRWLKSLYFAIVMFFLRQMFWCLQSIMQIIQNLDINYLMLLYITNLANPLPEWCRLAYSWTCCIYKVLSISLLLFLATSCIRCSFNLISTCHSIFTCRT